MKSFRGKIRVEDRYLSFSLQEEEYCIEILRVKEIMGMMEITRVPQTPDFIRGVVNLRGSIIPVIDLRTIFGLTAKEYTERTCIIVVELVYQEEKSFMGIVVDTIKEVVDIPKDKISKVPYINARIKSDYITGIGETRDGVKIIVAIEKVLTEDEYVVMHGMNHGNIKEERDES